MTKFATNKFEEDYIRAASLLKILDGETLILMISLGFGVCSSQEIKIARVAGPKSKDTNFLKVTRLISDSFFEDDNCCYIQSFGMNPDRLWICEIYIKGKNLNDKLLKSVNKSQLRLAKPVRKKYGNSHKRS